MNVHLQRESRHFALQPLAANVYAAIAKDGGWAICNAGLLDLGGLIVVFDTFVTPQASRDLRQASLELLGRPPGIVINSHYHNDHIWGNQSFAPETPILASDRTRALITTEGAAELEWNAANAAQRLAFHRAQIAAASSEGERQGHMLLAGEYEGIVAALPHLAVVPPSITFEKRLTLHGAEHTAELLMFEGGHTASDTVLLLRDAGILFLSDLLFVGFHPYLAEGDPRQLLAILTEISKLGAHTFIPGHGPIGATSDLLALIAYCAACVETARHLVAEGTTNPEQIAALPIPEDFRHWRLQQFYHINIQAMVARLTAETSTQPSP